MSYLAQETMEKTAQGNVYDAYKGAHNPSTVATTGAVLGAIPGGIAGLLSAIVSKGKGAKNLLKHVGTGSALGAAGVAALGTAKAKSKMDHLRAWEAANPDWDK